LRSRSGRVAWLHVGQQSSASCTLPPHPRPPPLQKHRSRRRQQRWTTWLVLSAKGRIDHLPFPLLHRVLVLDFEVLPPDPEPALVHQFQEPISKGRTYDDDSAGAEVGELSSSVLDASGESESVASGASPPSVAEGASVSESSAGVEADGTGADEEESPPSAGGAEAPPPP